MKHAASGLRQPLQWNGDPWPDDSTRGKLRRESPRPGARFLLVQIKGDWLEYNSSLGLPTWSSPHNPRCFCRCI
eukprot:74218-Pyramimonas_sp.AAC.1